jgi:hypothetical protein
MAALGDAIEMADRSEAGAAGSAADQGASSAAKNDSSGTQAQGNSESGQKASSPNDEPGSDDPETQQDEEGDTGDEDDQYAEGEGEDEDEEDGPGRDEGGDDDEEEDEEDPDEPGLDEGSHDETGEDEDQGEDEQFDGAQDGNGQAEDDTQTSSAADQEARPPKTRGIFDRKPVATNSTQPTSQAPATSTDDTLGEDDADLSSGAADQAGQQAAKQGRGILDRRPVNGQDTDGQATSQAPQTSAGGAQEEGEAGEGDGTQNTRYDQDSIYDNDYPAVHPDDRFDPTESQSSNGGAGWGKALLKGTAVVAPVATVATIWGVEGSKNKNQNAPPDNIGG